MQFRIGSWRWLSLCVAVACSGEDAVSPPQPSPVSDASAIPPAADASSGELDAGDAGSIVRPLSFSYRPSWSGVKSVEVYGGFGQSDDWKKPFLTLVDDGTGTFSAKAPALPNGKYLYIFRTKGDHAAETGKADTMVHYAIDPANSGAVPCPKESPTFTARSANPCSQVNLPLGAPSSQLHTKGTVKVGGAPAAGYLVLIERDEDGQHHMFADRTTTGADGTFDLVVAPGTYRFQVLHPTFYALTDTERTNPESYATARRLVSTQITIDRDRIINDAEVSFTTYGAMSPRDTATLPTTLCYAVARGTTVTAAVYGTGKDVGDPWWTSGYSTARTAVFDGGFNTAAAPDDAGVMPDATYQWGTMQRTPAPDGGVSWTAQSMGLPIRWP